MTLDRSTYRAVSTAIAFVEDDGGRAAAGYRGWAGDCVTRAIAIATDMPYAEAYESLHQIAVARKRRTGRRGSASPRNGVPRPVYDAYLRALGWEWVATMGIGTGTRVHLRREELPSGRLIVRLSRHVAAVVDGELHDTYDCSRGGTRAVYGFYHEGGK